MSASKAKEYLRNQVLTASREDLLLLLFDGAIRFAEQAKVHLREQKYEQSCNLLIRSQRIMVELIASLNKELLPEEIYGNLLSLYNFVYLRLIDGNLKKDETKIDEALKILMNLRETWGMAVEQVRNEGGAEKPAPAPPRRSLEIQG